MAQNKKLISQLNNPDSLREAFSLNAPQAEQAEIPRLFGDNSWPAYIPQHINNNDEIGEVPITGSKIESEFPHIQIHIPEESSIWDKLREALSNVPNREDYKPSKLRTIAAGIAGAGIGATQGGEEGYKVAHGIVNQPYTNAYNDWLTRTSALEKGANIELTKQKAQTGGLSDIASYIRATSEYDPKLQGEIAGAKTAGELQVREPYETNKFNRDQSGKEKITNMVTNRERDLERTRQGGREQITNSEINSREKIAQAQINSREYLAKLTRELKDKLSLRENQHDLTPAQQYLAKTMIEDKVAKFIPDPDEIDALFDEAKDAQGNPTGNYRLKPKSKITDPAMLSKWTKRKQQIDNLLKGALKATSTTKTSKIDDDNSDEVEDNRYEIEEVQ